MQRIYITAALNRSTLQFDEAAYARLESYLAEAARTLAGNPDQAEILSDLEQAIADQCTKRLPPGETVVTLAHLQPSLDEVGPVQVTGSGTGSERESRQSPRTLQQVSEGAVLSGVCMGLARYFGLDVTLLRIMAIVLLIASGGTMILVYVILMLLLPFAPPERGGAKVRTIPARSRRLAEYVRSKFNVAANDAGG